MSFLTYLPLVLALVTFLIFLVLDSIPGSNGLFGSAFLFLFFWWAAANLDAIQAIFYVLGILFYLIYRNVSAFGVNNDKPILFGKTFGNLTGQLLFVGAGVALWIGMKVLQSSSPVGAAIIGVPTLSVIGDVTAQIKTVFAPAIIGLLGVIENRAFFTVFLLSTSDAFSKFVSIIGSMLARIPLIGFIFAGLANISKPVLIGLAIILTSTLFGIFHLSVYGLNLSSIVFAIITMSVWITTYLALRDTTVADTSHWLWNVGIQAARQGVSIA